VWWANAAALEFWGVASLDAIRSRKFDFSKATRERLNSYRERLKNQQSISERWTTYPGDTPRPVICLHSLLEFDDGRPGLLVEIISEEPGEVNAQTLRMSEALRHTSAAAMSYDPDGSALMMNGAAEDLFAPPDAGKAWPRLTDLFFDEQAGQSFLHELDVEGANRGEVRLKTLTGPEWFHMDASVSVDPVSGSQTRYITCVSLDDRLAAGVSQQRSEKRLYDFANSSSDWLWELDADFRFTYFSAGGTEADSSLHDSVIGKSWRDTLDKLLTEAEKRDTGKWESHFADLDAHRSYRDFHYERLAEDGGTKHIRTSGTPVFGSDGTFEGYRGTSSDITTQIEAERVIRDQRQMFADAFSTVGDGMALFDKDDRLVLWNEAYRESIENKADPKFAYGRTFEELVREGIEWGRYGDVEDPEAFVKMRMEVHRNPPSESEFRSEVGRWMHISQRRTTDGGIVVSLTDLTEAKEREEALIESEKRFRDFAASASDWLWEMDADLRFTFFSGDNQDVVGTSNEDALGKTREELVGARLIGLSEEAVAKWQSVGDAMKTRETYRDVVFQMMRPDGKIAFIRNNGTPIFDDDGVFLGYRGTASDITAEHETEDALKANRQRFLDAIESLDDGIVLFDSDDRFVLCNKRYRESVESLLPGILAPGLLFEDLVRRGADAGMYGDLGEGKDEFVEKRLADHRSRPSVREHRIPGRRWAKVHEVATSEGGSIIVQSDITELKLREEALSVSERKYRELFDNSIQGIVVHQSLKPIAVNQAFAEIFGYGSPDDILALDSLAELMTPEYRPKVEAHTRARMSAEPLPSVIEYRGFHKDGRRIWFEARGTLVDWDGEPAAFATILDTTERKNAESRLTEALRQSDMANRAKSEFLANMSHELRTPLNAIIGFADMLTQEYMGSVNDRQTEYLRDITGSGKHLLGLINDILDLSKIEAGKVELVEKRINVKTMIDGCIRLLAERALQGRIEISTGDVDADPVINADERMLRQMLLNLLSNAVKFTQEGGKVTVGVETRSSGGCCIIVSDNGIGIASQDISTAMSTFGQIESALDRRWMKTARSNFTASRLPKVTSVRSSRWARYARKAASRRRIWSRPICGLPWSPKPAMR